MCQPNGVDALVVELAVDICTKGTVGVEYGLEITASSNVSGGTYDGAKSLLEMGLFVDPYSRLELFGKAKIDLALFDGDLIVSVDLIKLHLTNNSTPEGTGANFSIFSAAMKEYEVKAGINSQAYLTEDALDGSFVLEGEFPSGVYFKPWYKPHVKYEKSEKTLFQWDGINIGRQKLWDMDRTETVTANSL